MKLQRIRVIDTHLARPEAAISPAGEHASRSRAAGYWRSGAVANQHEKPDRSISLREIPQLTTATTVMDRPSKMEQMVRACERLSVRRSALLTTLLAASNPVASGGCAELRPLWANEAMHRAYSLVGLSRLLDMHCSRSEPVPVAESIEEKNASALAEAYLALEIMDDTDWLACSELIRRISRGLVELFGPAIGHITVGTDLPRLSLPAYKRRALVLACSELVVNSLRHAFTGRSPGSIVVSLACAGRGHVRLMVADDGVGIHASPAANRLGIAADLALLLEGNIGYRNSEASGTIVEISFPAVMCRTAGRQRKLSSRLRQD